MENKCWEERDGTHILKGGHVQVANGDPEKRMKFSLSNCTWLEKIEYVLVFEAL
jgi:hypothetical protein